MQQLRAAGFAFERRESVLLFRLTVPQCEQLADWAGQLIALLDGRLIEQEQGADRQAWMLEVEGAHWLLQFEHYSQCAWLEPLQPQATQLTRLMQQLQQKGCQRK